MLPVPSESDEDSIRSTQDSSNDPLTALTLYDYQSDIDPYCPQFLNEEDYTLINDEAYMRALQDVTCEANQTLSSAQKGTTSPSSLLLSRRI